MKDRRTTGTEETQHQHHLLGPALHHLREQRDAIKVDEFLGEGDVPGRVSQVFQGLQLSVHAGRLDPLMELDRSLVLGEEACVISRPRGGSRTFLPAGLLTGEVVKRRMEPFLMWLRFCGGFNETREDVSEHADLFLAFAPQPGIHQTFSVM